jgi:hypothetical protein
MVGLACLPVVPRATDFVAIIVLPMLNLLDLLFNVEVARL